MTENERLRAVIKILEADIKEQEALLKPMADAIREAIQLLPRCSTTFMRTAIEQYEFITGEKGQQYSPADANAPHSKPWDRISELEICIRQMCNNALDLGYCDMRDCHECKTFKVCGAER